MHKPLLPLLFSWLLAACSLVPPQPPLPQRYDLGPAAAPAAASGLRLAEIVAPPWLESDGIAYRLAYRDAYRREVYRDSRWAAAPAALLAQRLRAQGLGAGTRTLHLQLDEFEQVFSSATQSQAVLRARARLGSAERGFVIERDCPSADAAGAVRGLAAAADELAAQLARWSAEAR